MPIKNIKKTELVEMYVEEKMSLNDIAAYYEVSAGTIQNRMKKWRIKRRVRAEATFLYQAAKKRREVLRKIEENENGNR